MPFSLYLVPRPFLYMCTAVSVVSGHFQIAILHGMATYACPKCKTRIPFGTETTPPPTHCPTCQRRLYIPTAIGAAIHGRVSNSPEPQSPSQPVGHEHRKYLALRIAWSVAWGSACIPIVGMWLRGMKAVTTYNFLGIEIASLSRRLWVDVQQGSNPPTYSFEVPYSALMWLAVVVATIPWIPRRFSSRTMLLVTTLYAMVLYVLMTTFI